MSVGYISINGQRIRHNAKTGANDPPIRIAKSRSDKKPRYANTVIISGPSALLYSPDKPLLACGARLAIECEYSDIHVSS